MMRYIQSLLPFYVGFGFQNLIAARLDSWEKVLFALFIVWATDIGAYSLWSSIWSKSYCQKYHLIKPLKVVLVVYYQQSL